MAYDSPCINICRLEKGYCVGCKRSREEISRWFWMNDGERERVICLLKTRDISKVNDKN
jgi:uncharacterized protein